MFAKTLPLGLVAVLALAPGAMAQTTPTGWRMPATPAPSPSFHLHEGATGEQDADDVIPLKPSPRPADPRLAAALSGSVLGAVSGVVLANEALRPRTVAGYTGPAVIGLGAGVVTSGLGQAYAGDLQRGLLWSLGGCLAEVVATSATAAASPQNPNAQALVAIEVGLAWIAASSYDAYLTAEKTRPSPAP